MAPRLILTSTKILPSTMECATALDAPGSHLVRSMLQDRNEQDRNEHDRNEHDRNEHDRNEHGAAERRVSNR
jgi:hypothetical protein